MCIRPFAKSCAVLAILVAAGTSDAPLTALPAQTNPIPPCEAGFRGCFDEGWCKFSIAPRQPLPEGILRVRPVLVAADAPEDARIEPFSVAMRDHLNRRLSSMIHQTKRVVLSGLRELGDGTWSATVTVDGIPLSNDSQVRELGVPPHARAGSRAN